MTRDDREDARPGEEDGNRPPPARGFGEAPGGAPDLGGLLDGLPESGRGAQVRAPGDSGALANPFRQGSAEAARPDTRPSPPVATAPREETPREAPEPEPVPQAGSEALPRDPDPVDAPAPTEPPYRPNVIPFRSGERTANAPSPPAASPQPARSEPPASSTRGVGDTHPPQSAEASSGTHPDTGSEAAETEPDTDPSAVTAPERRPVEQPSPARRFDRWSGHAYEAAERAAVYRAIRERRDVRVGFLPDPVPDEVLTRVLEAAHQAPSVGHSQPWDFLVIEDAELRGRVSDLAGAERDGYARALPSIRARAFSGLKVEAVLEAPLNIAVTVDPTRGGRHASDRHARQNASHAAALAVENLWIAARAEGLGVGWLTFVDDREVARALELPAHLDVAAYLCVGYVEEFPTEPELSLSGWVGGRPLSWAVHRDRYGRRGLPGHVPTSLLEETITAIGALNTRAVEEAKDRQSRMTKPPGSLGVLEDVSVQLAGLSGECPPPIPEPAAVAVFAGDHGVHAQGVTPWPQEVTAQMVHNFLEGGAVVNAFAAQVRAEVTVVDVGVVGDLPRVPGLLSRKVARGTADLSQGPALSRQQALQALEAGIEVARDLVAAGNRCLLTGDMGVANTTPAAALVCAFTGADPVHATGRGAGAEDAAYAHKVEVVRSALAANPVDPEDPIGTLACLGGLEHAALAGFVLGGAALRVPVLLDGVIAGSAALAAAAISPESVAACFAGHRSSEPGHGLALEHLGLRPLVDLELRLGEGSGALLALPLLQGAARALRDVATFDDAGVSTLS